MRKSKLFSSISGFSLLELIIAISVAGIITTIALAAFTDLFKGFKIQSSRAERVREMIVTKKQIDRVFADVGSVESWSQFSLKYKKDDSDSIQTVQYANGSLQKDNTVTCNNLKRFQLEKKESGSSRKQTFLWESELKGGAWIGGAFEVGE